MNKLRRTPFILALALLFFTGCFFILNVTQPSAVDENTDLSSTVEFRLDERDFGANAQTVGIVAIMAPTDWTIKQVEYDGAYGPEVMDPLHPDSADAMPGKGTDYWHDTLMVHHPAPTGMDWYVFQGPGFETTTGDSANMMTVKFDMTAGSAGSYELAYMVSVADLGFEESNYHDVSTGHAITVNSPNSIGNNVELADGFALAQNYPNPFNPSTNIKFNLEKAGDVNLTVYNLLGKKVAVLANGFMEKGIHNVKFNAQDLPSGVYLYKLTAGAFVQTRKMALLK